MNDRSVVIKCGGNILSTPDLISRDVRTLRNEGLDVVIVHGGAGQVDEMCERFGVPVEYLYSASGERSRYSDAVTIDILTMTLIGVVNPKLVGALQHEGVNALGLTGVSGQLVRARRRQHTRAIEHGRQIIRRGDLVGTITAVNSRLIRLLLQAGCVPVICPPALDESGTPVNVNADKVACEIALAIRATHLIFLTDVPGVLRDRDDSSTLIPEISAFEANDCKPVMRDGMKSKFAAALRAAQEGTDSVTIADGRRERPVLDAMAGIGDSYPVPPWH